jgi:hypothetical protein
VRERVVALPFPAFAARFPATGGGAVPFHRIAYFKQAGAVVWWVPAGAGAGGFGRSARGRVA